MLFQNNSKTPGAVERLTDPSKYTGSHKERFDESGEISYAFGMNFLFYFQCFRLTSCCIFNYPLKYP